jgi:long-chain fatty acid transport protein
MTNLPKLLTTIMLSAPIVMSAQGFQVNLQGQVQQGMGGAGTALVQDAATVFFNPGGASFIKGNAIDLGVTATISRGQFLDKNTGATAITSSPISTPFTVYGVFGIKDSTKSLSKLKFGIGIYTPFGSTVDWEKGWMGRYALTHLQLQAIFFQPTVSFKLNEKLGIGAGFVYANGSVNLQKDIPVIDVNGNVGHAELNGKANGYGFNAGIYFKPIDKLSIGLTYRSQVNMNVNSGDATFTVPNSISANFPSGKFTSKLPLPQVLTLGFAYKPTNKLSLALDINYVGWKAYDTLAFDYANNTPSLVDTKSARNYKNIFAFRLGGQYKITENFAARLGMAYGISPIQNGYVTPETPDANRIVFTAGLGYTIKQRFGINASILFESLKREDANLETNLNGTYKTNVVAPGLSLSYKF